MRLIFQYFRKVTCVVWRKNDDKILNFPCKETVGSDVIKQDIGKDKQN